MEFIDSLVMPQSAERMQLLHYLLMLTYMIFLPYVSLLLGTTLLSVFYSRKGIKENNRMYVRFAKEIIDIITFNKVIAIGFGIIPLTSVLFCYAQLLYESPVSLSGYFFFDILLFGAAFIFIYSYKQSFHIRELLRILEDKNTELYKPEKEEIENSKIRSGKSFSRGAKYGTIFLLLAVYFFSAAFELSIDAAGYSQMPSLLETLSSLSTVTYFIYFLIVSSAITSVTVMFYYFRPNSDKRNYPTEYLEFVRKNSSVFSLISFILIPFAALLNFITKPDIALTSGEFVLIALAIILILIVSNLLYLMIRDESTEYVRSVIVVFILILGMLIVKDQLAFNSATKRQYYSLASSYEDYTTQLKKEIGIAPVEISGEDIFNGRCIACHSFDKKIVGPPYNKTLVKYENKENELIKFILNPVKVNPDYPAMPNQGLKPNEAKAIAEYILQVYKQNKGK